MRFWILALAACCLAAAEPVRVLFIGNSYTYYNNLPEIFGALARASGREVETHMVVMGGATLVYLWDHTEARHLIESGKWDYVVLQEQSQLGSALRDGRFVVNTPEQFFRGVHLFDAEIRKAKARTVLMLTWSRKNDPAQQADLDAAYDAIARETGAILVPAGPAWHRALRASPALDFYHDDGSHPRPAASYLNACVLLRSLFPGETGPLPRQVEGHPMEGDTPDPSRRGRLVDLPEPEAAMLQGIAAQAVAEVRARGGYLFAEPPRRLRPQLPPGVAPVPGELTGTWTGELDYYPGRAVFDLTLRFDQGRCDGDAMIQIPYLKSRYQAPLASCSLAGGALRFDIATLPLPALADRYEGTLADGRLSGTVERIGMGAVNAMTGRWSLRRAAAR